MSAALLDASPRGVIARGLGRSYGDLAQNAGGLVLDVTPLAAIREFDREQGTVTAEAGCSLEQLLRVCLPAGWFLPVTPGTRFVTIGGAIACDVHGKNHHRDGSFGRHVLALTLLSPDGVRRRLTPESTPSEFWATVGGLGLTGIVLDAVVRLKRVETAMIRLDVERTGSFDDALERLTATDHLYTYSVAWLDCAASGPRFGRAVLLRGDHAAAGELPPSHRLELPRRRQLRVPGWASIGPLLRVNAALVAFNELYYRSAREGNGRLQSLDAFFYPLDAVLDWNRLYGRYGFLQYQLVVPFGREDVLREVLRRVMACRPPVLAVMKRFGEGTGPLSFPIPGWTLSLDIPLPAPGLARALDLADDLVAEAGGRVYLAKDSRLAGTRLEAMYPRLGEWRELQAQLDPSGRMQCDLARRLSLVPRAAPARA